MSVFEIAFYGNHLITLAACIALRSEGSSSMSDLSSQIYFGKSRYNFNNNTGEGVTFFFI